MTAPPARLEFLGWDAPALLLAARLLAAEGARPGALELRDQVVVLPGGRAGRRLKELLLEEAEARRLPLFPPRIVIPRELPELLYAPPLPLVEERVARRLWSLALRDLPAAELEPVFPRPPAPDDLVGWETLAAEVQSLHVEVGAGGHRFLDVAGRCGESSLHVDDAARWRALAAVEARYAARLEGIGRADRQLARIAAAAGAPGGAPGELPPPTLHLVGVAELPRIVRLLLRASRARVRALVHAPAEERDSFDELGCVRVGAWEGRRIPLPEERLVAAGRPPEQAGAAVRAMAELGGRFAAEEITVAVPDEALVPYLEQRLGEAGVRARYAGGMPVRRSRPFRFLESAAEYAAGRAWEDFAALLRHPDVSGWLGGRRQATRHDAERALEAADRFHAERLPARLAPPPAAVGPRRGEAGSPEGGSLGWARGELEGAALLGSLPSGRRLLSRWMEPFLALLVELYARTPLSRDVPEQQRLVSVFEKLRRAAATLHALPPAADEECDAAAALRLLLEGVAGESVADDPDEAAVELVGWLELHLDDAPVAVVTGFNEPYLPQSVSAHAFLPDTLRGVLGLEDDARRYARDAYQLTAILASRPEVTLISGRFSADGDPLRPSRLLLADEGPVLAARVLRFLEGDAAPPRDAAPPAAIPVAAGDRSGFALPPEPVLTFPAPESISVTAFRTLIADPYLFVLEQLLRLRPCDDAAREMDGLVFGSLAHHVLQSFGESDAARLDDEGAVTRVLDDLLQERARELGPLALPAVRIQLEQLRLRLRAFARWQAERVRAGWETVAVEGWVLGTERPDERQRTLTARFPVDGVEIELRGRIDRVDRHRDTGEIQLLDYKTGDVAEAPERAHRRGGVWRDLQLPLYRHLAAGLLDRHAAPLVADRDALRLGYVLLPRELEQTGASLASWSGEDLRSADAVAAALIRSLREGRAVFEPGSGGDGPLAPLLGRRQLVAAEAADGEGGA